MAGSLLGRDEGLAHFAPDRVGFAVGDIHGRADLLALLLARLEREASAPATAAPLVIFLGDYVDRGPESAAVVERLCAWSPAGFEVRWLKGNHEAAMLGFLADPLAHRGWIAHGGLETLASYGVRPLPSIGSSEAVLAAAAKRLSELVPAAHLQFLQSLERIIIAGDYAFVHAGVDGGRCLDDQSDDDLLWARQRFVSDKRVLSHVIVHGHTPVETPYRDARRICLDTGAYATGRLSAARFAQARVDVISIDAASADQAWRPLKIAR